MVAKKYGSKIVIGLTGGVGSGKSSLLSELKTHYGALVLEADTICSELIQPEGSCFRPLIHLMGQEILLPQGQIDRTRMAQIIFRDPEKRKEVNRLLHPATFEAVKSRIERTRKKLIVYESALPYEARFRELCDYILYVWASRPVRIRRLKESRGYSEEKINAIMRSQLSEEEFYSLADAVLNNDKGPEETRRELRKLMMAWGIKKKE